VEEWEACLIWEILEVREQEELVIALEEAAADLKWRKLIDSVGGKVNTQSVSSRTVDSWGGVKNGPVVSLDCTAQIMS